MMEQMFDEDSEEEQIRIEEERLKMERRWKRGKHKTRQGKLLNLSEMTSSHLINTIAFFSNLETAPLKKELKKRGL